MQTLRFVKYKSWLLIADEDSYKASISLGTPILKIHVDMVPSLKILLKSHNMKGQSEDFLETIWEPFFKKFKHTWHNVNEGRQLKVGKFGQLVFVCNTSQEQLLNKALETLRLFLQRWAFVLDTEFKRRGSSIAVNATFAFSERATPALRLEQSGFPDEPIATKAFTFGNLRFVFEDRKGFGKLPDYVLVKTEAKAGDHWDCVHTAQLRDWELDAAEVNGLMKHLFNLKVRAK